MAKEQIRKRYDSAVCETANRWWKHRQDNDGRLGTIIQNQHATAVFHVCDHEPSRLTDAPRIDPSSALLEDILPDQGEIWVYCDTVDAALTTIEAFKS